MKDSKSISSQKRVPASMDYHFLRREAIENTQNISGNRWTDYNVHDPGVTIVEQFCYAITDIAYRTNIAVEDLLFAGTKPQLAAEKTALIPAEVIFTPGAITEDDYRILFIDHFPNIISNCWFNKIKHHSEGVKGLFEMVVHLSSEVNPADYDQIKSELFSFYRLHRNLCEDIDSIKILSPERLKIKLDIEVFQDYSTEDIVSQILCEIESYFNPKVKYYSLEDLTAKGLGFDEIFNVPSHNHGFIQREELKAKQNQYYISKIEDLIREVKGVRALKKLEVFLEAIPLSGDTIRISDEKFLTLKFDQHFISNDGDTGSNIRVFKGGVQHKYLSQKVETLLFQKLTLFRRSFEGEALTYEPEKSKVNVSELLEYESIQSQFPLNYGIGAATPPLYESKERQAQSAQLKGFLMLFDQIMTNHLAQLSKLVEILAIKDFDLANLKTYFSQALGKSVNGAEELIKKTLRPKKEIEREISFVRAISDTGSESYLNKIRVLEEELSEKNSRINEITSSIISEFLKASEKALTKSKRVENREIIKLFLELKLHPEYAVEKRDELVKNAIELIKNELYEKSQIIDYSDRDLEQLMEKFDNKLDRKSRILSHMLARFGEQFSTSFHLKFSESNEGVDAKELDRQLIYLKSEFLKQIATINQNRSKGVGLSQSQDRTTSLQKKVSLLLNLPQTEMNTLAGKAFSSKRVTGDELSTEYNETLSQEVYRRNSNDVTSDKAVFIINSEEYLRYLFHFGLNRNNYKILETATNAQVFFIPSNEEKASLIFTSKSKVEAEEKLQKLIAKLKVTSSENETFHIVEHILLRPVSYRECRYFLQDGEKTHLFKSLKIGPENDQFTEAKNTLILACYEENYRISKNDQSDFIVSIKAKNGKLLAQSVQSFMTVLKAEEFIKNAQLYFTESMSRMEENIDLDNKIKYNIELIGAEDLPVLKSIKTSTVEKATPLIQELLNAASSIDNYSISGSEKEGFDFTLSHQNLRIANSIQDYSSLDEIKTKITECVEFFAAINRETIDNSIYRFSKLENQEIEFFNHHLSVVFPNWTARFNNQEFLDIFTQLVADNAPAHLAINFAGLDFQRFKTFEKQYLQFLDELRISSYDNRDKIANLSSQILKQLANE